MQRMSAADFRKKYKVTGGCFNEKSLRAKNTRSSSSLCQDNTEAEILQQAIQAIQDLQNSCTTDFFDRRLEQTVDVYADTKADFDNLFKGIADSLQGFAFKNDKQVRGSGKGRIHDR